MNNLINNIRIQLRKLKCRIANLTNRVTYLEDNCCNGGGGGIQSIVPGDNVTVDNTDPQNPIVNSTGVTSVDMTVPTGFQVTGGPITSTGTLDVTYQSGYQGYTTAEANKLAGIEEGAQVNVNADWNSTSGDSQILNKPTLSTVAISGDYNDLDNQPIIPAQVNLHEGTNIEITGTYPNMTISATVEQIEWSQTEW